MNIKFSCKEQKDIFIDTLVMVRKLYYLNFEPVLKEMFKDIRVDKIDDLYDLITENKNVCIPDIDYDISMNIDTKNNKFEAIINDSDVADICNDLDLVIRIWIGQWEEFSKVKNKLKTVNKKEKLEKSLNFDSNINNIRNVIIPLFDKEEISTNGYLSIHFKGIDDKVRVIYDIYKTIMFENGAGGVYAYKPDQTSVYKLPIVEFEPTDILLFKSKDAMNKYALKEKKKGNKKVAMDNEGNIWFYTGEYISKRPDVNQKIYQLKNGYYKF